MILTLHHLPTTGGTLFTKALGTLNTYVLSEMHPYEVSDIRFQPMAVAAQFQAQYEALSTSEMDALFVAQIAVIHRTANANAKRLIIRDHSHYDFTHASAKGQPTILNLLLKHGFECRPLLTTRNPVEAYVSLANAEWLGGLDFETYCQRWLQILDVYAAYPLVRYEDFVASPDAVLQRMCEYYGIEYLPDWQTRLDDRTYTGDSGRSGAKIEPRPAKPVSAALAEEIRASATFDAISRRFPDYKDFEPE